MSPSRTSLRAISSSLCRVARLTITPPTLTGSNAATGVKDSHITGVHLRLPGHGDTGPTLEIFSYDAVTDHPDVALAARSEMRQETGLAGTLVDALTRFVAVF